jgi:hypothetical protein
MSDFNVGDKIEILYHANSEYTGKRGKVMYIGNSLKQGTDPLENNFDIPGKDHRIIIALDDNTIVNDLRDVQLRRL